jgi:uncharacterized protein (UPF0332 family)
MSLDEAREHLDLAMEQWERACTDAWEPSDAASCVTNAFYAYENLIVAVAEAKGSSWKKSHDKKAMLARELFERKTLSKDLHDEMLRLNTLRKDVSYGEEGFELRDEDLESLVSELESVLEEVRSIITKLEEEVEDE